MGIGIFVVLLLLPLLEALPPEASFVPPWLRVETVPVDSGELERWLVVETFVSLVLRVVLVLLRRCSTETPTSGEDSRVWRMVVRRFTEMLGSLVSS